MSVPRFPCRFLVVSAAVLLAGAAEIFGQPPAPDGPAALEPINVTGSRIRRSDFEGPSPVLQIAADEISRAGFATADDYLRQLPMISGFMSDASGVASFTPGVTSLNLRGLGTSAGLVLINGRRSAPYGQSGAATLLYDVGVLPAGAIDSVEILKDGGSALYGADAVAGVINFKLKRDYAGTTLRTQFRQTEDDDYSYRSVALTHGWRSAAGSLLIAIEASQNNAIAFSDRPVSRSEDHRAEGGFDLRYPVSFPASVVVPGGAVGVPEALTGRVIAPGVIQPDGTVHLTTTDAPRLADFVALPAPVMDNVPVAGDTRNGLDRSPYSSLVPAQRDFSLFISGERNLTRNLTLFTELTYRRRVAATFYEPSTISLAGEVGFGDLPGGRLVFPASNPYNPFGVDVTDAAFYLPEMGRRDNVITTEVPRVVAGLRGRIGETWTWEASGLATRNRVASAWLHFLSDQKLQDGLSGRLGGWLNPFGPSDPGVVERMRTDLDDLQRADLTMAGLQASGVLGQWRGGTVALAAGAETRRDAYHHFPHELRANAGLVSLSRRPPRALARDVDAAYVEFSVPFGPKIETQLAARGERYSDFGTSLKPKAALAVRPAHGLLLRGSFSQSFRAPELLQLYSDVVETFTQERDPRRPDLGVYTMRVTSGGNRALRPELTDSIYAGAVWDVPALAGLQFGVDYWRFVQRNLIGTIGAAEILRHETDFAVGRVVRETAPAPGTPGEVIVLNDTLGNYNRYTTAGYDFEVNYRLPPTSWGVWRLRALATWLRTGVAENGNGVILHDIGLARRPEWTWNAMLTWQRAAWDAALFATGKGRNDAGIPPGPATDPVMAPAFTTYNANLGYRWSRTVRLSIGVTNLLDANPPVNYTVRHGYANGFYDNLGRTYAVSLEKTF